MSGAGSKFKGMVATGFRGAKNESTFTRVWFMTVAVLAFGFSISLPMGCMSPPTRHMAMFSVNARALAHRYNAWARNTTDTILYDDNRLEADLAELPAVYRFGMSGVCREYYSQNRTDRITCTRSFPQPLDLALIIKHDISQADLPAPVASHLNSFWDSWSGNSTLNTPADRSFRQSLITASAGLTITSLVIAPLGLLLVAVLYKMENPAYSLVAAGVAILDSALLVTAAVLWLFASQQYAASFETTLHGQAPSSQAPSWGGMTQYPPSWGLLMFACVALGKLCVLPIMAFFFLVVCPLLMLVAAFIFAWLLWICLACLYAMLASCPEYRYVETY